MILDTGICTVFHVHNIAQPGEMPRKAYIPIFQGWYGELSFETSPVWATEGRNEQRVNGRIRILQNRAIAQDDVVILAQGDEYLPGSEAYRITRAYHGMDDEGPTPITDLTLEVIAP